MSLFPFMKQMCQDVMLTNQACAIQSLITKQPGCFHHLWKLSPKLCLMRNENFWWFSISSYLQWLLWRPVPSYSCTINWWSPLYMCPRPCLSLWKCLHCECCGWHDCSQQYTREFTVTPSVWHGCFLECSLFWLHAASSVAAVGRGRRSLVPLFTIGFLDFSCCFFPSLPCTFIPLPEPFFLNLVKEICLDSFRKWSSHSVRVYLFHAYINMVSVWLCWLWQYVSALVTNWRLFLVPGTLCFLANFQCFLCAEDALLHCSYAIDNFIHKPFVSGIPYLLPQMTQQVQFAMFPQLYRGSMH